MSLNVYPCPRGECEHPAFLHDPLNDSHTEWSCSTSGCPCKGVEPKRPLRARVPGLRESLIDLANAVGRPELVDRIARDVAPMCFSLTFDPDMFGNLADILDLDGYRHTLSVWNVGANVDTELQLFSLKATHPDNRNQYVVLTEHDLTHPIVLGLVLLATGTDEAEGALSREDALAALTELDKRTIPAPQRGMTELVVLPAPETPLPPTVAYNPPAWRRSVMDWARNPQNDDFTSVAQVAAARAKLLQVAGVARKRAELGIWTSDRPYYGVYQDGRPATIVVVDETWDLLAGRPTTSGGKTTPDQLSPLDPGYVSPPTSREEANYGRPDVVDWERPVHSAETTRKGEAALALIRNAAADGAQVFVMDPKASDAWAVSTGRVVGLDNPWPTAQVPGGDVDTPRGKIPGCVRSTCAHSRLAHDVEDDQDPVPLCGAPGCPCGKLTPALIREFPEYYVSGAGRERAQETLCRHEYTLVDSCPGCDHDQELEERIGDRHPTKWVPELVADIFGYRFRARRERGEDTDSFTVTVGDVINYAPPVHQEAVELHYMHAWWDLPRSRRGDLPQPPEHVCIPQAACGCCPGCGDGCGDCEGCIPCVPGFTTCVMPRGHEGDCVPPMTAIYAAHRRTLAVGRDGALL